MFKNRFINYMFRNRLLNYILICCIALVFTACLPSLVRRDANKKVPDGYSANSQDSTKIAADSANMAQKSWKDFFTDPYLKDLIGIAIQNNQGLNIIIQEINIANNEVRNRKGLIESYAGLTQRDNRASE